MDKVLFLNEEEIRLSAVAQEPDKVRFSLEGQDYHFSVIHHPDGSMTLSQGGHATRIIAGPANREGERTIFVEGNEVRVRTPLLRRSAGAAAQTSSHAAPMPCTVRQVLVREGDVVAKGDALVILEAMKLQLTVEAAYDGVVASVKVEEGALVSEGAELVEIQEERA